MKTGTEFCDQLADYGVSDHAYRTHHEVISWMYSVEKDDCTFAASLLRKIATSERYEEAAVELVRLGLWSKRDGVYEVLHHASVVRQSLAAQWAKRDRDANAQKKRTAKKQADTDAGPVTGHVAGPAPTQTNKQTGSHDGEDCSEYDEDEPWESLRSVPLPRDANRPANTWRVSGESA